MRDRVTKERKCDQCGRWYKEQDNGTYLVSNFKNYCPECAEEIEKYRDAKIEGEI